jgi:hypothetical protein
VTQDDLLYRFRLQVFSMAADLGNSRAALQDDGHPSLHLLPLEAGSRTATVQRSCGPESGTDQGWPTRPEVANASGGWPRHGLAAVNGNGNARE